MSAVGDYRKATHAWENTPTHDEDEVIAYGNAMEAAADAAIAELEAENERLKVELACPAGGWIDQLRIRVEQAEKVLAGARLMPREKS